jgi:HSP20 family protein
MAQVLPERRSGSTERWSRGSDLDSLRRLLDETFGLQMIAPEVTSLIPLVDVEETDDAYVVEAEVPGVKRNDVNIEVSGNELSITGEIKEKERKGIVRHRTRKAGQFEYHVTLPEQVDADKIEASLNEGVLTVRIPKAERAQRRKIEVKA